MATDPAIDIELNAIQSEARPLGEWLTTFPLALTIVDPFTHESGWVLDSARRIMANYNGADCRMAWLVTGTVEQTKTFLGPLAEEFLTFAHPDRALIKALGLESLPAFVVLRQDGSVLDAAESWNPATWRRVAESLAELTSWSRPAIPGNGDPRAYPGTPALA